MGDDDQYHYIHGPKHDGHYDIRTTETISTMDKSVSQETGISYGGNAKKDHVYTD